jgi:hypothetical protein
LQQVQQQAEAAQQQAVLQRWGLSQEQAITLAPPLPAALQASMAVCMMPPAQLYALYAEAVDAEPAAEPAAAAAAAAVAASQEAGVKTSDAAAPVSVAEASAQPAQAGGPASLTLPATASAPATASEEAAAVDAAREQKAQQLLQQVSPAQQLKVLTALRQQLQAKLACMATEQQLAAVLSRLQQQHSKQQQAGTSEGLVEHDILVPSSSDGTAATQTAEQQQPTEVSSEEVPSTEHNPYHAQLAVTYVTGQRSIIQAALQQVTKQLGVIVKASGQQQAGTGTPTAPAAGIKVHAAAQVISTSTEMPGTASGLMLQQAVSAGELLITCPAGTYLAAADPPTLMLQAVIAQFLHSKQQAQDASPAGDGSLHLAPGLRALLQQLQHSFPAGLPELIITSGPQQQQLLQQLLQGTAVEAATEEAVQTLAQQFDMVQRLLQMLVQLSDQDVLRATLLPVLASEQQKQQLSSAALPGILQWKGLASAILLAVRAVEAGAVRLPGARADGGDMHSLVPIVCSLPTEVRQAALQVSRSEEMGRQGRQSVIITAACHLPAGTPLGPACSNSSDAEQQLMQQGPAKLAAVAGSADDAAEDAAKGAEGDASGSAGLASSYELCISPPDGDPADEMKLQLLAASGLGTLHVLTSTPSEAAQRTLLAAMAICLADSSSVGSSDACQKCLQLHQQVQSSRSRSDGAEPLDGFATLPAADAGAQGAAGPKAGTGLAVDVAGKQRLLRGLAAAAAAVVHQWSGSAGGKQPKEARKQLRSMLGDARQQLKAQLKAAKGKSAGKALGSNVAAGVAVYVRSQIDVLASWSASLSAGSSTGSKRSDPVEQLQQRQKKQKS